MAVLASNVIDDWEPNRFGRRPPKHLRVLVGQHRERDHLWHGIMIRAS